MISTVDMAMSFIFTLSTKCLHGRILDEDLFFAFNDFAKEDLNISLEKSIWFYG